MRVRSFVQDDGHIFCTEDQIQSRMHGRYAVAVRLSTRDFGFDDVVIKSVDAALKSGLVR